MLKNEVLPKNMFKKLKSFEGQSDFESKVLAFSSALEKLFPKDFNQTLETLKVKEKLEKMNEKASEIISQNQFSVNLEEKTISLNVNDEETKVELIDLKSFIEQEFETSEGAFDFYLIYGFLLRPEKALSVYIVFALEKVKS